jgi:predicted XRE-type DNA-binding protein
MRIKFNPDQGAPQGGQVASATPVNEGGQNPFGQVVTDDKTKATDGSDKSQQVDPNAVAKAAAVEPGKEPVKEPVKDPAAEPKDEPVELKLPEGSILEASAIDDVKAFAKEHGLSGKQAQALLEKQNAAVSQFQSKEVEKFEQTKASWIDASKADKEIGGENFSKAAEFAKRAYDQFATPEFKTLLQKTGAENHPEFVRVFYRIGKLTSDSEFRGGGGKPSNEPRAADVIFGEKSGG